MEIINPNIMLTAFSVMYLGFFCFIASIDEIYPDWLKVVVIVGGMVAMSYLTSIFWYLLTSLSNGGLLIAIGAIGSAVLIGLVVFIYKKLKG